MKVARGTTPAGSGVETRPHRAKTKTDAPAPDRMDLVRPMAPDAVPARPAALTPKEQYDVWAQKYDAETASYGWCAPQVLNEAITNELPPRSAQVVLDVGVGTGLSSLPFLEVGAQVTGVDISAEMLGRAKLNFPGFHNLAEHDINRPLADSGIRLGNADLVVSCGVLHFAQDLRATVQDLAGALAPGGLLAFTYIPPQDRAFGPSTRVHSAAEVESMLRDAGLKPGRQETFTAYHDKANPEDPVQYALVLARKPGTPPALPPELERVLDRTSCVDRKRIAELANTPLVTGPARTTITRDSRVAHEQCDRMVDSVRASIEQGREIDVRAIQLPSVTAVAAYEGKPGCDVLAIFPHPDDESVYTGGTLAGASAAGYDVRLATSTAGGGGRGGVKNVALAETRREEQKKAASTLGISVIEELGFSDFGKYRDASRRDPITALDTLRTWGLDAALESSVRAIRQHRPTSLVSFEPERDPNYSLHGHHLGSGVLAMLAFHLAADPHAFPEHFDEGLRPWAVARHQVVVPSHVRGARSTAFRFEADQKMSSLRAHASQAYSTERLLRELASNEPDARKENWHLLQARRPAEQSQDSLRRLFGHNIGNKA